MSRFSIFCQKFFLSNAEKFRRGTLLCSRKVLVSKIVRHKRGGQESQFPPSKFLCFTVPKIFVGEPFIVSLISGIESFYASEGYVKIFDFLSKSFRLTVPKIFLGEPSSVSFISAIKKFWKGGGREYLDFASKFFVSL